MSSFCKSAAALHVHPQLQYLRLNSKGHQRGLEDMERLSCVRGRALTTIWKSITEGLIMNEWNHSRQLRPTQPSDFGLFGGLGAEKTGAACDDTRERPHARGSVIRQITEKK